MQSYLNPQMFTKFIGTDIPIITDDVNIEGKLEFNAVKAPKWDGY